MKVKNYLLKDNEIKNDRRFNMSDFLPEAFIGSDTNVLLNYLNSFWDRKLYKHISKYNKKSIDEAIEEAKKTAEKNIRNTIEETEGSGGLRVKVQKIISDPSYKFRDALTVEQIEELDESIEENLVYKDISILKKIELLRTLRDPDTIAYNFLNDLAKNLGYSVGYDRAQLNFLVTEEEADLYTRNVIRELPNWYVLKGTDLSLTSIFYNYGLNAEVVNLWTNTYSNDMIDWVYESLSFTNGKNHPPFRDDFYPTPHFIIMLNAQDSKEDEEWVRDIGDIASFVESVKPVYSVFEGFSIMLNEEVTFVPAHRISTTELRSILGNNND